MQEFFIFAAAVILISTSGVMSPGPLFASNILYGIKQGTKSGIYIALGHAIVELPLIITIGVGIISLESIPEFRIIIAIIGAVGLFAFAGLQIRNVIFEKSTSVKKQTQNPILTGIILSALNPFFIIWWFTIGFKLISDSMEIWSFYGIFVMFGLHIWMDFAWLGSTAFLASKGSRFLSEKHYKIIGVIISVVLIYFGITFLIYL